MSPLSRVVDCASSNLFFTPPRSPERRVAPQDCLARPPYRFCCQFHGRLSAPADTSFVSPRGPPRKAGRSRSPALSHSLAISRYRPSTETRSSRDRFAESSNALWACSLAFWYRWKDYAHHNKQRTMTLACEEFLRRFLQHLLPKGFPRIRYFGWLANRRRSKLLLRCRALLPPMAKETPTTLLSEPTVWQCPAATDRWPCTNG